MLLLLLLGAEVEEYRGARPERRNLDVGRKLVAGQFLVERGVVRGCEALAAVLGWEADAGEAGVEQHPLHRTVAGDGGEFLFVGADVAKREQRRSDVVQVCPDPFTGPLAEALDALDVCHNTISAMRWRWSAGVP